MKQTTKLTIVLIVAMGLLCAKGVNAQTTSQTTVLNSNVPAGFNVAGYIQAATEDSPGVPTSGGTLTINGINMVVPGNSAVQFPTRTLTWDELFDKANRTSVYDPAVAKQQTPFTLAGTSGLALLDNPYQLPGLSPYLPFNATVFGNIDLKGGGGYYVGLILPIGQDLGNSGQGFVTFIDYAKGRFEVGGTLSVQNTGTVIEINDPTGRYGYAHSPDPRWSADSDNPTFTADNGYPMCVPKVAPPNGDPNCPSYNRPLNTPTGGDPFLPPGVALRVFQMPAKAASNAPGDTSPDPWKQAPIQIGDYITFGGVLFKNNPVAPINTRTPWNRQTYISANTVTVHVDIYTAPGPVTTGGPAYVYLERQKTIVGVGGISPTLVSPTPSLGIGGGIIPNTTYSNAELQGSVTDSTAPVDIVALDIDPTTGAETCTVLGTVVPEQGGTAGGKKGRFRFEITKGNFLPVTRKYAVYSQHGQVQLPNQTGTIVPAQSPHICSDPNSPAPITGPGNGLISGQYRAPIFRFMFTDSPPGFPVIPLNFNDVPFLTQGEGGNPSAGPLNPFPAVCPLGTTPTTSNPVPTCQP